MEWSEPVSGAKVQARKRLVKGWLFVDETRAATAQRERLVIPLSLALLFLRAPHRSWRLCSTPWSPTFRPTTA